MVNLPKKIMATSTIVLKGMEFYAYHGCFAEEKIVGTNFLVDLYLNLDTSKAQKSDRVEDTINYVDVYALVKKEMQISSNLIENLAARIRDSILATYPQIESLKMELTKLNPPIGELINGVSIILETKK